jgi:4-hydroxy-3-methylbut-2-enyl diphosphate reductase
MLRLVDAVVVVGGRKSNNTLQLVSLCQAAGKAAFHVQTEADIDPEWFSDCHVVGLTAGTSTPDDVISQVYQALCQLRQGAFR